MDVGKVLETVKTTPLKTIFVLAGTFLFVWGLTGGISVGPVNLPLPAVWARAIASAVGLIMVGVGVYSEFGTRPSSSEAAAPPSATAAPPKDTPKSRELLYSLQDDAANVFPRIVTGARRVAILGRTALNLMSGYQREFEKLGLAGCTIRILVVDPDSVASKVVYGNFADVYKKNVAAVEEHFKLLTSRGGHSIEVRKMNSIPPFGLVIVEHEKVSESSIRVSLYFTHGPQGRDRPIIRLDYGDKWYQVFMSEFEALWSGARPWDEMAVEGSRSLRADRLPEAR